MEQDRPRSQPPGTQTMKQDKCEGLKHDQDRTEMWSHQQQRNMARAAGQEHGQNIRTYL